MVTGQFAPKPFPPGYSIAPYFRVICNIPRSISHKAKQARFKSNIPRSVSHKPNKHASIEDITWLRSDTKFLFECWQMFHEWAQRKSKIFSTRKGKFVSPSGHVMCYSLYKHQWNTKPFRSNSFFPAKGAIYYVAIATVIFSHVRSPSMGSCTCENNYYFHVCRYHVFARKLTWYFIGVYIIKYNIPRSKAGGGGRCFQKSVVYENCTPLKSYENCTPPPPPWR